MTRAKQREMNRTLQKKLRDISEEEWKRFWELHKEWTNEILDNLKKTAPRE